MCNYRNRVEVSFLEQRDSSIVFHYDGAFDYRAAIRFANDLAFQAKVLRGSESYKIIHKNDAVHAEPDMNIWMDHAAEYVLNAVPESAHPDYVFVAGGVCGHNALFRWADGKQRETNLPTQRKISGFRRSKGSFSFIYTVGMGLYSEDAKYKLPLGRSLLNILGFLARAPAPYTFAMKR
ncbi:hypothetical protein PENANT_c006G09026 [Penicillium antarcticum]|uniref:Uncharacterized protein n=1 Tax=Penicillium antarcticum TaxID=416450 RepID=A0A1V6QDW1_9EURO|nr:hypothetical protein PENANT_c006G09026 [Penicillium antarcticum]